jgi:cytochrome c-type biogenesis protein CcmH
MSDTEQKRWRGGAMPLRVLMIVAGLVVAVQIGRTLATDKESPAAVAALADPVAALEARTKENPEDVEAWTELGARHFDLGRFDLAVTAYDAAIRLAPMNAALWSARGESRVMASTQDPMPALALTDFETAIGFDPKDPRARYFLAVRQDLAGDHRGAIDAWLALLADTPPGAVWEADLRRTIEQVGKINGIAVAKQLAAVKQPAPALPPALAGIPGPSAADLSQAAAIPPSEQRQMAEGMVARLEGRLRGDPANVEGWLMLIRSRMTLGQGAEARAALASAVAANPGDGARLREQAAMLGVK